MIVEDSDPLKSTVETDKKIQPDPIKSLRTSIKENLLS